MLANAAQEPVETRKPGAEIKIPAKTVPAFTAGKKFKDMVK